MADYKNTISILITAQDEASAVIAASAAQVEEAQTAVAERTAEAQASIVDSNERTAEATTLSNDEIIASYKAVADAAEESAAKQDASGLDFDAAKSMSFAGFSASASTPYLVAAAAVAAATYEMVKQAGDFQKAVTQIYSSAGETAPLQTLDNGLLQIARDTGTTTEQLTSGLYTVSSAGYNAASGLTVLRAAAEGAKAENADLSTVTDALTTVMHDYGYGTSQAYSVTNMMIAAVSAGKMHLQDFASSLSTVLPIAKSVGLSFAQIAGAEATLTAAGVSADQATQDLHAVISTLIAPTTAQVTAMQQMGLSSVQLSENLGKNGLTSTLNEMFDAITEHIGPNGLVLQSAMRNATLQTQDFNTEVASSPPQLQKLADELLNGTISFADFRSQVQALPEGMTNLGKQIEGTYNLMNSFNTQLVAGVNASPTFTAELKAMTGQTNSMNAILMLTGNNAAKFNANVKSISSSANDAGNNISSWALIQGNFNQKLDELREDVQTIAIQLGESLLPILTKFFSVVVDILQPLAGLAKNTRDFVIAISVLFPPLGATIGLFWLMDEAIKGVGDAFAWVGSVFDDIRPDLDAGVSDITAAWSLIEQGAERVEGFLAHIWDQPGQAAKRFADDLVSAFNSALYNLSGWAIDVGSDIAAGIGQGLSDAEQWGDDLIRGFDGGIRAVIRNAPQWGRDVVKALESGATSLGEYDLSSIFQWYEDLDSIYQTGLATGKELLKGIGDSIAQGYHDALEWGNDLVRDIYSGFTAYLRGSLQLGKDLVTGVGRGIVSEYHMAFDWGRSIIDNIVSGLKSAVSSIGHFFTTIPGLVEHDLKTSGKAMADAQLNGAASEFKDVGKMKNLGNDILKGIGIAIAAVLGATLLIAMSLGIAIINGIISAVKYNMRLLSDAIEAMWSGKDGLKQAFDHLTSDVVQWATDAVEDIIHVFETLPSRIGDTLTKAGSSFVKDIGRDLHIPGFAGGTAYAPGGLSLVGENGPELVNLPQGSQVLNAAETRSELGAGNGGKVVINQLVINNNVDARLVIRQIGFQLANAS